MEFKLEFNMDGADFDEYPEYAIQDILETIIDNIRGGMVYGICMDRLGNKVGKWEIETD